MVMNAKKPQKEQLKKIKTLVGTYSQAIEYYQSIDSDLYVDLNYRMQQLLTRPEILEILDKEAEINAANANNSPNTSGISTTVLDIIQDGQEEPNSAPPVKIGSGNLNHTNYEVNERQDSPDTNDSVTNLEVTLDKSQLDLNHSKSDSLVAKENLSDKDGGESTPKNPKTAISSKATAKFDIQEDCSNEFVYHRSDRRNRHGVSFKVCKNRKDGALIRPKVPKNKDKKEIHTTMLNENNAELNSTPRVQATKEVIEDYKGGNGENLQMLEKNIYGQESAFRVRLLKRHNEIYRKKKTNDSSFMSDLSLSFSPKKDRSMEKQN